LPKGVESQTIYDPSIQPPPISFLQSPNPSDVSKLYLEWQLAQKANKLVGRYGGPCVTFARNFTQATPQLVSGVARDIPTNANTPIVGAIVKTNESRFGHLAVVIAKDDDNLTIVESNYRWNGIIDIREISATDPRIEGYITIN
jgi:surface antigen